MGELNSMSDELNINPQIADSEPSTAMAPEPFDVFRQVDEANAEPQDVVNQNDGDANAEANAEANIQQQQQQQQQQQYDTSAANSSDVSQYNAQAGNNNQPGYPADIINDIYKEAKKQREEVKTYREFINSPIGRRALEFAEQQAALAEQQNKQPAPDGKFRKAASDVLGINEDDPFFNVLNEEIDRRVEERMSKSPQAAYLNQLQEEQEANARIAMGKSFAKHLSDTYGMPENVASQAAFKAMSDAQKRYGKLNEETKRLFYNSLCTFEAEEVVPVGIDIFNKQREAMMNELKQLRDGSRQPANSSTGAAAERMLSQQNANYKASGTIPNGSAVLDGYDEGDDIRNFIAFGNKHYLG